MIAGFNKLQCAEGANPFDALAFTVEGDRLRFKEHAVWLGIRP